MSMAAPNGRVVLVACQVMERVNAELKSAQVLM